MTNIERMTNEVQKLDRINHDLRDLTALIQVEDEALTEQRKKVRELRNRKVQMLLERSRVEQAIRVLTYNQRSGR